MPSPAIPKFKSSVRVAEVKSLTGLRGLAAIYVVLLHFTYPLAMAGPFFTFVAHGYMAVDVFFVLSGFVMAMNYNGMFERGASWASFQLFLGRRFARIYPLHLFTLAIYCVYLYRHSQVWLHVNFWANVFLVQTWGFWYALNGPEWSLSAEWFAYLLFPFLVPLLLFKSPRVALAISSLCVIGMTGLVLSTGADPIPWHLGQFHGPPAVLACVCEFSLGIAAYRLLSTPFGQALRSKARYAYLISALCLVLLCIRQTDLAVALLCPVLVVSLDGTPNLVARFLGSAFIEWLGLLSFSIYLLHMLVYRILLWPLDAFFHRIGYPHAHTFATFICLAVLLPLAALTYYGVEIPARRGLRKILEPAVKKAPAAETALV